MELLHTAWGTVGKILLAGLVIVALAYIGERLKVLALTLYSKLWRR